MHPRTRTALLAATLATVLLAAPITGCSAPEQQTRTGELVYVIEGANVTDGHLDIHSTQIDSASSILRNVFDSLVAQNEDGQLIPWLATEWSVSSDGREYLFTLRDDVQFHNGERLTPAAVVQNLAHVADPNTASAQALDMLGGERFQRAEVRGEHQVAILLTEPFAPLLRNLSGPQLGMYAPNTLSLPQADRTAGGSAVTVGSGPFRFVSVTPGQEIVLERFTEYAWAPQLAPASGGVSDSAAEGSAAAEPDSPDWQPATTIRIRLLTEPGVRIAAFNAGEALVAAELPSAQLRELTRPHALRSAPVSGLPYSLLVNDGFGPLAEQPVRDALRLSLNRVDAVAAATNSSVPAAQHLLAGTLPGLAETNPLPGFDPAAAATLLDRAGWSARDAEGYRTKAGKRLTLNWVSWTPFPPDHQLIASAFQADAKAVGIELVHETLEPAQYMARYTARTFDLTDWSFAALDPDVLRAHLADGGYQNVSSVPKPQVDAWLTQAVSTTDQPARLELYTQVLDWNAEFGAIIPVMQPMMHVAISPAVSGIRHDETGRPVFVDAKINRALVARGAGRN